MMLNLISVLNHLSLTALRYEFKATNSLMNHLCFFIIHLQSMGQIFSLLDCTGFPNISNISPSQSEYSGGRFTIFVSKLLLNLHTSQPFFVDSRNFTLTNRLKFKRYIIFLFSICSLVLSSISKVGDIWISSVMRCEIQWNWDNGFIWLTFCLKRL